MQPSYRHSGLGKDSLVEWALCRDASRHDVGGHADCADVEPAAKVAAALQHVGAGTGVLQIPTQCYLGEMPLATSWLAEVTGQPNHNAG